jgi:glycosyltransferase involved in cell wall biosynthesis
MGGVESFLKLHYQFDPQIGVTSDFVIYLEGADKSHDRIHCLGISASDSIRTIGQKLRGVTDTRRGRVALYHLPWAGRFFCPHDHASRRIFVFHSNAETAHTFLARSGQFFDGFLCVNPLLREVVRSILPETAEERIAVVNSPVASPPHLTRIEPFGKPIRLGYVGRIDVLHKRIDRIPEFSAALQNSGTEFNLTIIGEGPRRDLLEAAAPKNPFHFAGVLQGDAYWKSLSELDCILFFSDLEGTPMALLEAMSQGVIPVFPRINCGGDSYVGAVDEALLYPPGDMQAASAQVARLSKAPQEQIAELRKRCREAVRQHSLRNYFSKTYEFVNLISKLPRISSSSPGGSMALAQYLTVDQITRARDMVRWMTGEHRKAK